jgi:hypothetical protein
VIRRRHVIYVEGYDPQGAEGYYGLFQSSWRRFLKIWPLQAKVAPLQIDSDDFAHWDIEAGGPNWQVSTRYDFVRQEEMIRANMAEPLLRQVMRAVGWAMDYLITGTMFRVFRASWQYGAALLFFQLGLLIWITLSVVGGWFVAHGAFRLAGLPEVLAIAIGVAGALAIFMLLKPLANKLFLIQINSHWPYLLEYARGEKSCFDRPVEQAAARLVEVAKAGGVDEILVIGHSGGGVLAPAAVARALELDPDLGRHGTPVVLLTLGSIMPGAAVHRHAVKLHAIVKRLAVEPSVRWIDAQSRKDVLNFWDFDPVNGIGVDAGSGRCNPLIWKVRFRDMLSPEFYKRIRLNFFRMHYQFIMANDQRAPYDYFMLVCGPAPAVQWAERGDVVLASFDKDAAYKPKKL